MFIKDNIIKDYNGGMSIDELKEKYKKNKRMLYHTMKAFGVKLSKTSLTADAVREEINKRKQERERIMNQSQNEIFIQFSAKEVADTCKCTLAYVYEVAKREDFKFSKK